MSFSVDRGALARLLPAGAAVFLALGAGTVARAVESPPPPGAAELPPPPPFPAALGRAVAPLGFAPELDPDHRHYKPRRLAFRPAELLDLPTLPRDRSLLLPIGETLLANAVIWSFAWGMGERWTRITFDSTTDNLRGPWTFDPNGFATNQLGHPYQGHLSFSAARSAGFSFWGAAVFPLVSSTLWELFAETDPPSINDAITTPVGGTFLGEVLFRLSRMVLDAGGLHPSGGRQALAWLVSPTAGLSYTATGNRFRARDALPIPAAIEVRLGASFGGNAYSAGRHTTTSGLVSGSVQVTHGLPIGGWTLQNPFDHFDFLASVVVTRSPWAVLQVRGLLAGDELGVRQKWGFWGLWGLYDLTTVKTFRVSTSALGVGVTGERTASNGLALQGTAIAGAGFGAAGTRIVSPMTPDYHYGAGVVGIVDARVIAGDRGAVRLQFRQYYVGGVVSPDTSGHELVAQGTFGATLRVIGRHAVGLDVTRARRWAGFRDRPDSFESFSQAIAYYAFVGDKTMGSGLKVVASGE